jgi:hypothetical protein
MASTREPMLYVACGRKGIGKTQATLKMIRQYIKGNSSVGLDPRKVIIIDVNNEFGEFKSMACDPINIKKFVLQKTIECRRIVPYNTNGKKKTLDEVASDLAIVLDNFTNGLVLVEDISKFVSDSIGGDLIGSLCTQRHVDCDVVMHFQMIGKAGHPKIKGNTNIVRLHKTDDTVSKHKNKFLEATGILQIAELIVNKRYFKGKSMLENAKSDEERFKINKEFVWFWVYVNYDTNKITGRFTREEFEVALEDYMTANENEVLGLLLKKKDTTTGRCLYDWTEAFKIKKDELFQMYYGNPK